jgi:hypothetical protein
MYKKKIKIIQLRQHFVQLFITVFSQVTQAMHQEHMQDIRVGNNKWADKVGSSKKTRHQGCPILYWQTS